MNYFEKVSAYKDVELEMPVRGTEMSAGYDLSVAEDIVIPSYFDLMNQLKESVAVHPEGVTLSEMAQITKTTKCKPTLVPTGMKCHLDPDSYLQLSVRSSCPLKNWLIMANGVGIIDADYWNNPDNEGAIYLQLINLSPWPIQLKRGDRIGQGIILKYDKTQDDSATGARCGGFGSTK